MTITGNIDVDYIPTNEVLGKGSNIIGLKINNAEAVLMILK